MFVESLSWGVGNLSSTEDRPRRRTMVDDSKVREELAKMIGLDAVPEMDPNAIDKLNGLLDDFVDGPVDSVQLIKEGRIRDFYKDHRDLEEV